MEMLNVLSAGITVFAFGLLCVSLASYRKYKTNKLLFVTLVFLVFFIKGILYSIGLFYENFSLLPSSLLNSLFDLIVLILLFAATIKR